MIVVEADKVRTCQAEGGHLSLRLRELDGGEAYSTIGRGDPAGTVSGSLHCVADPETVSAEVWGSPDDTVRVFIAPPRHAEAVSDHQSSDEGVPHPRGFVLVEGKLVERLVQVVPLREELFSRTKGLFETDVLADKTVFIGGVGSGAAPIAMELVKLGILNHIWMDDDRVEVGNVGRHVLGLSDVGRLKTKAMRERALDKNPFAEVVTSEERIGWQTKDLVREFVRKSDLVVCGVDDHEARVVLNRVCVAEKKPLIVAAAFRRAYGGQVLFVLPGQTPCYQCFLQMLPEKARDQEVSSQATADRLAYSDRPVEIEPGLSSDIAPISQMVVKLAIQHLLKGAPTTLRTLDEDLVAPWYLWLNRRERETEYEHLEPLEFNVDGMHVLRWYGIDLPRDPTCACCGDFLGLVVADENVAVTPEDAAAFGSMG